MTRQVRKPRNINYEQSARLQSRAITAGIDLPPGWELYVTDSAVGRTRSNSKTCTVPLWARTYAFTGTKCPDFDLYYVAHEAAHAWNYHNGDNNANHGPLFYVEFKRLCPPELWHHELGYKTREAKRAGIHTDPLLNIQEKTPVSSRPAHRITDSDIVRQCEEDTIAEAIRIDPRLKKLLAQIEDKNKVSYIRGWFKTPAKR